MNNRILKRYVALEKKRRDLDKQLKETKKSIEELDASVLEQLRKAEVQSLNIDGMTLYIRRELWVKIPAQNPEAPRNEQIPEKEAAISALAENPETAEYVNETFNSQSVSAFLREIEASHDIVLESCNRLSDLEAKGVQLPEALQPIKHALGVSEVYKVGSRLS